jgi:glycosyltransferase involved in cell wall biosynthesis
MAPGNAGKLRGYSVIYFGNDWFAENRTSSHHIARRLAAVVPVLYIETPGIRAPQATGRDLRKLWRKLRTAFAPPRKIQERLYLATIPQVPFRKLPMVGWLNLRLGIYLTRRAIRTIGVKRWLSWFVVPHPGALAKRLGEALSVYYCIDDYAAFPGMDPVAIQAMDDDLTRRADVVFVAPPALVDAKRKLNRNVHHSPHGVDFDLFAQASDPSFVPAAETQALPRPVIGYFGVLGDWIDYDLLSWLAESRPRWTFLFVGHTAGDVGPLRRFSNIVLAGAKPYEELPRWAHAFDVAIYPNRLTRQTIHANPLKIREYLATGKPIVAVPTQVTTQFSKLIYLADTKEAYLAAIERAMTEETPERRAARMQAVAGISWDARFRETVTIVENLLAV